MDRRLLRPGWIAGHLLVLVAVLVCLRLGWWQWERAHESDGTVQNLGYAMLWPAFAVAFVYMWIRFLRLEKLKQAEDNERASHELAELLTEIDASPTGETGEVRNHLAPEGVPALDPPEPAQDAVSDERQVGPVRAERQRPSQGVVLSVATVEQEDPEDPELTAYNQALAALAEEDRRRARRPRR